MKNVQDKYGVFWYNQQEICHWRQEDFDRKAADFASAGVNIVMTFSSTHFRWSFYPWWEQINGTIEKIVRACHKYDIKVVEHHSSHLTHDPRSKKEWDVLYNTLRTRKSSIEMFPGLKEYISSADPEILPGVHLSECRQIDGRTGDFARTIYTGYGHCFNNPHYRKVYFDYLKDLYSRGIDGIMTDDVQYFGEKNACTCKYCREQFKAETGFDLPLPAKWGKFSGNFADPVYIEWLRFRIRSTERFHRAVNAHFESLGLQILRPNYATCPFSCNTFANPFETAGDLWSCIFTENMFSTVIRTAWPSWHAIAEQRSSMIRRHGVMPMSMFYPARYDDYYFCWSLAKAWNHLLMASPEGSDLNDIEKQFGAFDAVHPVLEKAVDLRDIGFLEPRSSLDFLPDPLINTIWPLNVPLQGALFRNLRNGILFEDDTLEEFLTYPLVVLCGANMLSDDHLELLKRYCEQGGRLLVCGTFGLYKTDGSRREHPEKVFGIEAQLSDFRPTPRGEFIWKGQSVALSPIEESRVFKKVCGETEIIARTEDGSVVGISALNGRFVWLAGGLGGRKPENHYYDLRISRWLENPGKAPAQKAPGEELYHISGAIQQLLLEKKQYISCSSRDYLATVFLASDRPSGEVHLVNTAGTLPETGELVSHDDIFTNFLPGAPKNRESFTVTLTLPHTVTGAQAYSPEFNSGRGLDFTKEDNSVIITVPPDTFSGYLKIKLTLK